MRYDNTRLFEASQLCRVRSILGGGYIRTVLHYIWHTPINNPLRDPTHKDKKGKIFKPVVYPVITYHLNEFIKKCRTLAANSDEKNLALDLYHGMSNVCLQDIVMKEGVSELASP